jgi:hypothetical protein
MNVSQRLADDMLAVEPENNRVLAFKVLDEHVESTSGYVSIATMHLAKGLEFRAVVVMACDDEIIPLQERIEAVGDDADLQEVYDTERQLLYVACTRARDHGSRLPVCHQQGGFVLELPAVLAIKTAAERSRQRLPAGLPTKVATRPHPTIPASASATSSDGNAERNARRRREFVNSLVASRLRY